jgi:hypothetical protein
MLEHLKIALASASELIQAREAQAEAEQLLAAGPADALPSDPAANEPKNAADAVNPPASVAEPIRPQCLDEPVIAAEPRATEVEQQSEPSVAETNPDAASFEPPGEPTPSTSEPAPSPAFVDAAIEPAASSAAPNGQDPPGDAPQMNKGAALPDVDLADYDPGAPTAPTSKPVRKESNQPACVTDNGKSPPPGEEELADFLFEPAAAAGPEPALEPAAPQQAAAAALSKAAQEIAAPEPIWDQSLELAPPMPSIAQTNPTPPAGPVPASASHAAPLPARANPADPLAPLLALSDEEKIALFS